MVRFDPTYVEREIKVEEFVEIVADYGINPIPATQLLVKFHLAGWMIGKPYGEPRRELSRHFEQLCTRMGLDIEPFWKILRHTNFSGSFDLVIGNDTLEAIEDFMSMREYNNNTFQEQLAHLDDQRYEIIDNVLTVDSASHGAFVGMNHNYTNPEELFNIDEDISTWEDGMRYLIDDTVYGFVFEYLRQKKEQANAILD
jgi:hypothetical protein